MKGDVTSTEGEAGMDDKVSYSYVESATLMESPNPLRVGNLSRLGNLSRVRKTLVFMISDIVQDIM